MASHEEELLEEISREYERRDRILASGKWQDDFYHPRNSFGRLQYEHHRNLLIEVLNILEIDLRDKKVLDFGCGDGQWLRMLVDLGATPGNLTGIDLSEDRIDCAKKTNPAINWIVHKKKQLPFDSSSFDIILIISVYSSIPDETFSQETAKEIMHCLKTGGTLLWIDLKKPVGKRLRGFAQASLLKLFPKCEIVFKRQVHPLQFRVFNSRFSYLARLSTYLFPFAYQSWCFVLHKNE